MNVQIGADDVLLNLDRNQRAFEKTVSQLSSGLRINSAADDPSGNAIATNLTSKVGGLQQAAANVQNGVNALNVANGALKSVQDILIRVNNLLVEADSDINSSADLQDIQSEINELLTEINTIGEKTNFNGQNLLNGAFDDSSGSNAQFFQVASPYGGTTNVANETGTPGGPSGPLITGAGVPPGGYFEPSLLVFTVTGYSSDPVQPDGGGPIGAPGVYVQFDAYSSGGPNAFGNAPLYQDVTAIAVNSGQISSAQYTTPNGANILIEFTLANLTAADVGASIAFQSVAAVNPSTGTALTINDGGDEGQTIGMSLPTVNTSVLGISQISAISPQVVDFNNVVTGTSASNNVNASYSQLLVKSALTNDNNQ